MGTLSAEEIRDVNVRYHDVAADHYDSKWGISFDELGQGQVRAKLRRALGQAPGHYERALEIGAGTGYFTLNMLAAGIIGDATCTDISPGMLAQLAENAAARGLVVATVASDAERLPFDDASFDLVFGHAVLHHIPDLAQAFSEMARVLAPGGALLFAGEPSRWGDRLAGVPKRLAGTAAPLWRLLVGARAAERVEGDDEETPIGLESKVDVHAFAPGELSTLAREAGLERVRVSGEELLANWFGWTNRTLEASADPDDVPWLWRQYAYRGYLALQAVDRSVLESHLPSALFYNLMLSARKPGSARRRGPRGRPGSDAARNGSATNGARSNGSRPRPRAKPEP